VQVNQALAIGTKDELPRIAPLRHVVRNINRNDTKRAIPHKIAENVPPVPRDSPDSPNPNREGPPAPQARYKTGFIR
jgi:hypothetical protein